MGRKLGPEAARGRFLDETQYESLWRSIAEQPKSVRRWLLGTLHIGINDHTSDATGVIADVSFGAPGLGIESVTGPDLSVVFSKAIALAVDRRLDTIVRARIELDQVVERLGDSALALAFERYILKATTPTSSSAPSTATTAAKKGTIE